MPAKSAASHYRRMFICAGYGTLAAAFVVVVVIPFLHRRGDDSCRDCGSESGN